MTKPKQVSLIEVQPYAGPDDAQFLFSLLLERTPEQSISHKVMPTWDEHLAFVRSHPYTAWHMIADDNKWVGAIYLSKQREIGVAILKKYQRKGYGRAAVMELMRLHPGKFLANIAPKNEASIRFFESIGFTHLQNTYALDA